MVESNHFKTQTRFNDCMRVNSKACLKMTPHYLVHFIRFCHRDGEDTDQLALLAMKVSQ